MSSKPKDRIIRATGAKTPFRLVLIDLTECANEIGQRHGATAYSLKLLAETSIASLFLASGLKNPGTVSVRVDFSGDISLVRAEATPQGLIRAMIPPEDILATQNFEPALAPQNFQVVKLNDKGIRVQESVVEAVSESMGRNLATYMFQSEQTHSAVGIEAKNNIKDPSKLDYAVGFYLEAFPDLNERDLAILEQVIINLPKFDTFYDGSSYSLEGLLDQIAGPYDITIVKEITPQVYCPCSKIRTLSSLASIPKEDLEDLLSKEEDLEMICDFCRNKYIITPDEIREILNNRKK